MHDAVIFDLDGTLVDSLTDIAAAMNHVLAEAGHPAHGHAAYERFVGDGAAALVERAMPPGADHAALLAAFRRRYAAHCLDHTRPLPGIEALVRALAERGQPIAVLSNKPHAMTERVVAACFAPGTFAAIAGERPGVARKPDPAGALAIAAALDVPPSRCWLVGDTRVDVRTAQAAGMRAVAVTWGMRREAELAAARPDRLVREPAALLQLLTA